jgi:hypothetical protein
MSSSINRRLVRLEAIAGVGESQHHVVTCICETGESFEAAEERYRRDHPDKLDYTRFIVIRIVHPLGYNERGDPIWQDKVEAKSGIDWVPHSIFSRPFASLPGLDRPRAFEAMPSHKP